MKKYKGEEFLNKLYKNLVHSDEVKHTAKGTNKNEDLAIYLERLNRITKEASKKDKIDLLKYFYYKKYVIKEENIPESYFKAQEQLALERGYGHITYNNSIKKQEISLIIEEQKESLDRWLDYFISEDTHYYPMWFKYYVFQNVIKIGYFDKEKNSFTKRTNNTVKPFIEINREAIAMLYSELNKYLDREKINDEALEKLIRNGSFNKIYSYIIRKLDNVQKTKNDSNEGTWKKYNQGSDPEILFNDIHGKGTGWCTAGGITTAQTHLDGGDFYVFYTMDKNNEYTIPRIAIRMEHNKIAEIRGIAERQNLESDMESVVEEKLNEFPDKEEYKKKVSDMKKLTNIYKKYKNKEELTKEDLSFIYEFDDKIIGFGYEKDSRIDEIISKRNIKKDLSLLLEASEDEISFSSKEALKGNVKFHYGDLNLVHITQSDDLILPEIISGDLNLPGLKNVENLNLPKKIFGSLNLSNLRNAKKIVFPEIIRGYLNLASLKYVKKITLPKEIGGKLRLNSLTKVECLELPKKLDGDLELGSLTSVKELKLPEEISGSLDLSRLTSLKGLVMPKKIGETLILTNLKNIEDVELPKEINSLWLSGLTSAEGLNLPKKINGDLEMNGLISAKGLNLPEEIGGVLLLNSLINAEGLNLPKKIGLDLSLRNLTSAKGLEFPKKIGGTLYLTNLTSAEELRLPEEITDCLLLNNLINAEGLILPKNNQGDFYVPGCLMCPLSEEELIEAAKRTKLINNNTQDKKKILKRIKNILKI